MAASSRPVQVEEAVEQESEQLNITPVIDALVEEVESIREEQVDEAANREEVDAADEATYGDTGWKKREGPRKDKFGNVIKPKNVAKHLAKQGATKAATQKEEQVDELSRKTLGSYVSKASDARGHRKLSTAKLDKRYSGVARASQKLDKKQFEEVELDEAINFFKTSDALMAYAKKHGGIDKADFEKAAMHVRQLGKESDTRKQNQTFMRLKQHISSMDTDPRDGVLQILKKHGMFKNGRLMQEEVDLDEKTLTPAEKKKREEIAKAIERDNPKMPMDKKMAIATAQAKKVAESVSDRTKDLIQRAINRKT